MDDAIKAGRRRSAADLALGKALGGDFKAFALKLMDDADEMAAKMSDYLKALGFEDEDGDGAVSPDEAAAQVEDGDDASPPLAGKALDLHTRHAMLSDAVHEALDELDLLDQDEPDTLGDAATPIGRIAGDYRAAQGPGAEACQVYVYDDHAVACLGAANWRIPYTIEGGTVVLGDPGDWARVEMEWADIPGGASVASDGAATPVPSVVGAAVKLLDDGTIVAQAIHFGSEAAPDMSAYADFFTKATDFWLNAWDRRPMLYHHAMDADTQDAPRIGEWTKAWADDAGVWLQGQLDKAHKYHAAIKELARRGLLRVSTDSAPHLVRRERQPSGAHAVKTWPIMAASLTPTPAEPRLLPAELKTLLVDLGLDIDDSPEAPDATSARPTPARGVDDAARRLALELDLLELETL